MERGRALNGGRLPCVECHGADGAGTLVADAQPVWTWYAPNITRGGRTRDYTASDWDRIIRHGIKPDGTPATMPAMDFQGLSDQEVSDLAAFFWSLEPKDTVQPPTVIGPVGKALIGTGKLPLAVDQIDHERTHPRIPPPAEVTVEFGSHVAATCVGCHRMDYSGGPLVQGPPDWPPAANLTPHVDGLAGWTEEDFTRALREGVRPDGTALNEPMASMTRLDLTDTEVRAMFLYLQQLEPKPTVE